MEKKKILFVMEHLGIGGAEKSLVTLLSYIDYSKYEVDLFLFSKTGEFLSLVPNSVNILPESEEYKMLHQSPINALLNFLMYGKVKLAIFNLLYLSKLAFYHLVLQKEYIGWEYIKKIFKPLNKQYDVAIGFLEKKTIYFIVDKINADKKSGYIHNDYLKNEHNQMLDNYYFNYLDHIVTVSEHSLETLQQVFSHYHSKFKVIKNIISPSVIHVMGNEKIDDINTDAQYISIVTVARLVEQKGIDNAILICDQLVKKNSNIRWYIIGEGSERDKLKKMIKIKGIEKHFILLGARSNPYKYMKMADIYVQPSRSEGYGITVAEAKALYKPIVVSKIPEFQELIINLETGLLCDTNESMANAICNLINDENLKQKFSNNLKNQDIMETKIELKKFYEIIG